MITEKKLLSKEIYEKIKNINQYLSNIKTLITKQNKNPRIFLEHLVLGEKLLKSLQESYKLQFKGSPKMVLKNEIFYCKLGHNVGSEQSGKRPVLILQNNKGNNSSTTTIIAPISTHEGTMEQIYEIYGNKKVPKYIIKHKNKIKKLDYYEIPVEIEKNYIKKITGYINIAQIRTISKKRLDKIPVAKITKNTEKKINIGLNKLLKMY